MAQLLLQWLNDEIQLSSKVNSFEKDFSNGYLFGELLGKYNQQLNFEEFQNKHVRASKIKNFQLLLPTFKTLKVSFDTKVVDSIIKEQQGVALQLLYQLKMALEKVNDPADVLIHSKNGKYNAIMPLKRIQQPKEEFDKMEAQFFERRLNELNRAQKQVNLDDHQEKFERFKQQQEEKIRRIQQKDELEQRTLKEEMRKIQLNKLQRNMAFMEDWNQKGIENWKKNQDSRKLNLQNDVDFKTRLDDRKQVRLQSMNDGMVVEMTEQLGNFENNLLRLGLRDAQEEEQVGQSPPNNTMGIQGLNSTAVRVPQSKVISEFLRKERDKRRRKMIVDQEKQHGELHRREQAVLLKLKQQSKQEKEILYEVWRAYRCKQIIGNNREMRSDKYRQKLELNVINIKYKEEEMLRTVRVEYQRDLELQSKREAEMGIALQLEKRQINSASCAKIVNYLIQLSEYAYDQLQSTDSSEIGLEFLDQAYTLFVEDKAVVPPKEFRTFDPLPELKNQENSFTEQKQFLADHELQQYINGTGAWVPQHQMQVGEGPNAGDPAMDEKLLPSEPINNTALGNLIKMLTETSYPLETNLKRPLNYQQYLPFRCSLIGYQFSGKKIIAELMQKKYGVEVISVDGVVRELIEYQRRYQERERQISKQFPEGLLKSNSSQISLHQTSPRNIQEISQYWDEEMLQLANEINGIILSGQDISDALYVRVICFKINKSFPPVSFEKALEEVRKSRKEHMSPRKQYEADDHLTEMEQRDDFHKHNLEQNQFPYCNGYILLDFPHTYEQAKLLEKCVGGFLPDDEREVTQRQQRLQSSVKVVRWSEVDVQVRQPIDGGILLVGYLGMPNNYYSLKRALGRRYDDQTKTLFHLDDNAPPVDNAPLLERIQAIYSPPNLEQSISDKNNFLQTQIPQIQDWYSKFAQQEGNDILQTFQTVDASNHLEDTFYRVDQLVQKMLEISEQKILNEEERNQQVILMAIQQEEALKTQQQQESKWVSTDQTQIQDLLQNTLQTQIIEDRCLRLLNSLWERTESNYLKQTRVFFIKTYEQRQFIQTRVNDIQLKFIDFLKRHDEKFYLVRYYQDSYNHFAQENPDMLEEEQTKEELHQRVEDLVDTLGDIVEQKRDDALEEKRKTQEFGWVESEMEQYIQEIQRLLQSELDRSYQSIILLQDYYTLLDGRELPEISQEINNEILLEQIPIESLEDPNSFPRLDKLVSEAIRVFNGEEDQSVAQDDKNKKGAKATKKDEKKATAPPPKKGVVVEEIKREISKIELDGQKAINTEKAIFRYRAQVIKDSASRTLKQMRDQSKKLYQKMEDWAYYAYHCEIDSIKEMSFIFKEAIETEQKIQKEIQLNFVDVVISHQVLNFLTPIPPPLTAREPSNNKRLSISQLYHLIEDLRAITSNQMTIEAKQLGLLLGRKQQALQKEDLCETLHISTNEWMKMISKIQNQGHVNVRTICTYLILLNSTILDSLERGIYQKNLETNEKKQWLQKEEFVNTIAWFDSQEGENEEENTNYFDRSLYIKELLFFVHKDPEQDQILIQSLLNTLHIKNPGQSKTYYEFLFSQ